MTITYLFRRAATGRTAHVWLGEDTACRMASTGGLNLKKYVKGNCPGSRTICKMCLAVSMRDHPDVVKAFDNYKAWLDTLGTDELEELDRLFARIWSERKELPNGIMIIGGIQFGRLQ